MWIFYILSYYLIVWLLTFIGVKLDNIKYNRYILYSESIAADLKNGHIWWLVFPPVNIIAAIVYFIRGLSSALSEIKGDVIVDFLFGKKNFKE